MSVLSWLATSLMKRTKAAERKSETREARVGSARRVRRSQPASPAAALVERLEERALLAATSNPIAQSLLDYARAAGSTNTPTVIDQHSNASLFLFAANGDVSVRITANDVNALLPLLEQRGFHTIGAMPDYHVIDGTISAANLNNLADLTANGLFGVLPIYRPITAIGNFTSEADFVQETERVRNALPQGYDGSGITIGVLSDSFNNRTGYSTDILTGDLPSGIQVIQDMSSGGTDEGRAMLQLVHDLAPGATLKFATAFVGGESGFANNIQRLATAGSNIIVDDVIYFAEPMFQDGIVARAVDQVVAGGVAYFSSAGNQADQSWEATSPAVIVNGSGTFGNVIDFNPLSGSGNEDFRQDVTIRVGEEILLALQWDDPFYTTSGVDTDLDIFLVVRDTDSVVASSTLNNRGNRTPFELLDFFNDGSDGTQYQIIIQVAQGPAPGRVKYVNYADDVLIQYDTDSSTVYGHAAAEGAQAIAAVPYFDQTSPESFTSIGTTTILFDTFGNQLSSAQIRQTPDLAGIDGTNTTFFGQSLPDGLGGNNNFFGTSAAAPHVAAIAALVKQANSSFSPAQIYTRLQNTATDLGVAGVDNVTGYGLVNAYDAIFGPAVAATGSYTDSFESGGQGTLGPNWETHSTGSGRIRIVENTATEGTFRLEMDSFGVGSPLNFDGRNEAILHLNATGSSGDIVLQFDQREFSDSDQQMPPTFTGSGDWDGVAISVDGTNWFRAFDLTGTLSTGSFDTKSINITQIALANGLTLTADTRIKFQQFGRGSIQGGATQGGFAFDNIRVTRSSQPNQAPVINAQSFGVAALSANGTVVGQVVASDPDVGQTLTYSITAGNTGGAFTINASTGVITVLNSAAVTVPNSPISLLVKVQDNGNPSLFSEATITITIGATVNRPPVLDDVTFSLPENSPNGTVVGTVTATDPDVGDVLHYSIIASTPSNPFAIDANTGVITVINSSLLDFETTPTFQLTILVTDSGGGSTGASINWVAQNGGSISGGQVEGMAAQQNPVIGAVHTILAHPTNPDIMYLGATNGGIWKTTNATSASGPTWIPLTDQYESLSIGAMTFDTTDPTFNTIVVGHGVMSSFGSGDTRAGFLRTTDGGATWTSFDGNGFMRGRNISGVVAAGSTIVAAVNIADSFTVTNVGIFLSTDGGASFTRISQNNGSGPTGLPAGVAYDLIEDPTSPGTLYTSIIFATLSGGQNGIYKSTDYGATWSRVSNSTMNTLMDNNTSNVEFAVGNAGQVYAGIIRSGQLAGLFRSGNGGSSWTQLDTPVTNENGTLIGLQPTNRGPTDRDGDGTLTDAEIAQTAGAQGYIHFSMAADPTNVNIVYLGGDRQPRSNGDTGGFPNSLGATNFTGRLFRVDASLASGSQASSLTHLSGVSTNTNSAPHADSREIVFDAAGNLIEGDDGGIYKRTNPRGLGDWVSMIGTGLQNTEFHSLQYDTVSNVVFGGTQDVGTPEQTTSGAASGFTEVSQGDGGVVAVFNNGATSIRYTSFQNLGGLRRRTVNASNGTVTTVFPSLTVSGGGPSISPQFYTPIATHATDVNRLVIAASNGVYESLNQGATVTFLGGPTNGTTLAYGGSAGGSAAPEVLWVGNASGALFVRTPSSGSLNAVSFPGSSVRDIVLDPRNWQRAYVTTGTQVFLTLDAGANWTEITDNLDTLDTGLRTIEFVVGASASGIVVGGNSGVYALSLDGAGFADGVWREFAPNLPNAVVYDLDFDDSDDVLAVGTLGRGAWIIDAAAVFQTGSTGIALTDTAIITINLTDVVESANNPPTISPATFVIAENSPVSTVVGTPTASDPDAGQTLTWAITGGNASGAFTINASTGQITVANSTPLNFEVTPTFSLTVRVTDNGSTPLSASATITINLTNVNEAPVIGDFNFTIPENSPNGTVVGTVTGTDPDGSGGTQTHFSTNVPVTIPDQTVVTSNLTVSGRSGAITDVNVSLDITHTFDGDLEITLIAPDGTRITLVNNRGSGGEDFTGTTFDDEASTSITTGSAPFSGSFRPEQLLSLLDGKNANGTWQLEVADQVGGDSGVLNSWSLTIATATTQPLSYSLSGPNSSAFAINSVTGQITVANSTLLDFETNPVFNLIVTASDGTLTDTGNVRINLTDVLEVTSRLVAYGVGPLASGLPFVDVFDSVANTRKFRITAYENTFRGGVKVATGDINKDGTDDIVVVPQKGRKTDVKIYSGVNGALLGQFTAFAASYTGGASVDLGDVNNDGWLDVVVGNNAGFAPEVQVWNVRNSINSPTLLRSIKPFETTFRGGLDVGVGDVNGDSFADVVVARGAGGKGTIQVYSGQNGTLLKSFDAYTAILTGGLSVDVGDFNRDGRADIVVGAASGMLPEVTIYSGLTVLNPGTPVALQKFLAYPNTYKGGVNVALRPSTAVGAPAGAMDIWTGYNSAIPTRQATRFGFRAALPPIALQNVLADTSFMGGLYVG